MNGKVVWKRWQVDFMSSSCEGIRAALKSCLIRSECVLRQGHLPSECLKEHYDELPDQCRQLRRSLFECKRGMVRCVSRSSFRVLIVSF